MNTVAKIDQNQEVAEYREPSTSTANMLMDPQVMQQLHNFALVMSKGGVTVPQHLKGNVGDCLAIAMQAAQWGMNPFAVAQKTHLVSGTLGYEAQLVNAVVSSSTAIKGRFKYEWFGNWDGVIGNFIEKTSQKGSKYSAPNWTLKDEKGLGVRVYATLKGDDEPTELVLLLTQAQVRNSTLWASDPKQQLAYLAVKRWARLYCPDVILGVYSPDELDERPRKEREVNPDIRSSGFEQRLGKKRAKAAEQQAPVDDTDYAGIAAALIDGINESTTIAGIKSAISALEEYPNMPVNAVASITEAYNTKGREIKRAEAAGEPKAVEA